MSGPFKNKELCVQEYVYDFSVDGGAVSTITLSSKSGVDPLPVGAIVKSVSAQVLTAFTSGGSATLSWGNGDSVTAYSGTAIAVASLTANAVFNGMGNGSSSLWDDTQDSPKLLYIDDATTGAVVVAIATAAMTAGKMVLCVEYYLPKSAA